jgi:hypothetical protein
MELYKCVLQSKFIHMNSRNNYHKDRKYAYNPQFFKLSAHISSIVYIFSSFPVKLQFLFHITPNAITWNRKHNVTLYKKNIEATILKD